MKYKWGIIGFLFFIGFFFLAIQAAPRVVTDQLGRKVCLPDNPQRIVALAPSITEIVFALKEEHRLKGVTRYSDFPPQALKYPRVGSYVRLDLEKIVTLQPDLCIATKDGNPKIVIDRLVSLNIPVFTVDPRNSEAVMKSIIEIGVLLDAGDRADALVGNMRRRIQRVESLVDKAATRPRVFFQIGISPIISVGTHTFSHELIVLAGGKNLAEGPVSYPRFSREQVVAFSPEVLIISSMQREAVFEEVKSEWSQWPDLPAVKNNRIFLVDSNLFDRPTPRLVDGLELLLRLIHPEIFEENP
jgi:iron complex transport system substrate-binding protein